MSACDAREHRPDDLSIQIDNHYANMDDFTTLTRPGGVWDVLESTLAAPGFMKNKVRLYIHFASFSNLSPPWTERNIEYIRDRMFHALPSLAEKDRVLATLDFFQIPRRSRRVEAKVRKLETIEPRVACFSLYPIAIVKQTTTTTRTTNIAAHETHTHKSQIPNPKT